MPDFFNKLKGILGSRSNQTGRFSVDGFASSINKTGIMRPTHFIVVVTLPSGITPKYDNSQFAFRIESVSLPTRSILTSDLDYYGPVRRIPYRYNMLPVTMTVILSEDAREREIFQKWQDLLVGSSRQIYNRGIPVGQFDSHYYKDAVDGAGIEIFLFGESPQFQQNKKPSRSYFSFNDIPELARTVGFDPSVITNPFGLDVFGNQGKSPNVTPILKVKLIEPYPFQVNQIDLSWADESYGKLNVEFNYHYYVEDHTLLAPSLESTFANDLRKGVEAFNKFKPVFSLIKGQGLGGGTRALLNQAGGNVRTAGVAQKSILPF